MAVSQRYQLTPEIEALFPDEREALRGLAAATDALLRNLALGDEPIRSYGRKRHWWQRKHTMGWKNELSVSAMLDIKYKWLPLARKRLGLDDDRTGDARADQPDQ